jgi:hypothetical protein
MTFSTGKNETNPNIELEITAFEKPLIKMKIQEIMKPKSAWKKIAEIGRDIRDVTKPQRAK